VDGKCWPGIGNRHRSWGSQEIWYRCGWGSNLVAGGAGMGEVSRGCGIGAKGSAVVGSGVGLVLGEGPRWYIC